MLFFREVQSFVINTNRFSEAIVRLFDIVGEILSLGHPQEVKVKQGWPSLEVHTFGQIMVSMQQSQKLITPLCVISFWDCSFYFYSFKYSKLTSMCQQSSFLLSAIALLRLRDIHFAIGLDPQEVKVKQGWPSLEIHTFG